MAFLETAGRIVKHRCAAARFTLAADHRVSNGHQGVRFLASVADRLARPEAL